MKVCIISKYPPIEGGVSSGIYWLAKGLGELGHKVYIVSNCMEVEEGYREELVKGDLRKLEPKNVRLFSTNQLLPRFIPASRSYVAKLVNLAIDAIRKYDIDIIYSQYLLPYGVAALMVKQITKKPWLVDHAGSDITRLFDSSSLKSLFTEIFKGADMISTTPRYRDKISKLCQLKSDKFILGLRSAVNLKEFNPCARPLDISLYLKRDIKGQIPIFLYLGKVSKLKKSFEFVKACSYIRKEHFRIVFVVGNNTRAVELKKYAHSLGLRNKAVFLPFQPPWRIPSLINMSTCIVSPESAEEPFLPKGTHYPRIAREAMACGKCVIIGKDMADKGLYRRLKDGLNCFIIDPDKKEFAQRLKMIVRNPDIAVGIGQEAIRFSENMEHFEESIQRYVMIFKMLLFSGRKN